MSIDRALLAVVALLVAVLAAVVAFALRRFDDAVAEVVEERMARNAGPANVQLSERAMCFGGSPVADPPNPHAVRRPSRFDDFPSKQLR